MSVPVHGKASAVVERGTCRLLFGRRYLSEGSMDAIYTDHAVAELPAATPPQGT
ncbi:hypothetical protein [Streptomyces sp. NBC_00996]|uniref:hypothetical protein n=1 Tax=Streptomyces sp. NBC_00996 TaxID=2903710 RepID=UPI00386A7297|nr:hypothetical protein OG390_36690 [Streptomyces sp. NBC_00996]